MTVSICTQYSTTPIPYHAYTVIENHCAAPQFIQTHNASTTKAIYITLQLSAHYYIALSTNNHTYPCATKPFQLIGLTDIQIIWRTLVTMRNLA